MTRILFTLILSLSLFFNSAYSQRIDDFVLLQSKGKIPEDFIVKSSDTYKQSSTATTSEKEGRFEKKAKNQFLLKSSFDIRELLYNGKIVFNDTLSSYINKVADKLLEKDPDLRSKLKFYIVQSPVVNAFTTNSGQIFVNMGLLAYLRNESQLAFVISHEIMHYKKQHVLKSYVETQKIIKKKGEYKWLDNQDYMVTKNNYSREIESEADLFGYDEIFKNSDYTPNDLPFLFEMFKYADLPYKHEAIDMNIFFLKGLPDSIKMDSDISIKERTDSDSTSTHPTPDKRSKALKQKYDAQPAGTKSEYLVSKEEFLYCRNVARMHLPFMYLLRNDFEKTLYFASLINKDEPDSKYLKDMIGKGLYGYTMFRSKEEHSFDYEVDGGLKKFNQWIEKINHIELHFLTIHYLLTLKAAYPTDSKYDTFIASTAENLIREEKYDYNRLYNDYLQVPNQPGDKRISYNNVSTFDDAPRVYFFHLLDSAIVKGQMRDILEKASKAVDNKKRTAETKRRERNKRSYTRRGACLGIDSLVLVNPDYEKIDQRKKKPQRYVASESAQVDLNDKIVDNAGLNKLYVDVLDDHTLKVDDVERYNDLATLTNWFNEKVYQLSNDVEMENLNPELVKRLTTKYGTKYFAWTGYRALREKKTGKGALIVISIVYFPLLPITTYYLLNPKYNTYHYFVLFNIETGEPEFVKSEYINRRDREDVLNSSIYDTFYQLKKEKKK
jgi:Zn-dependent protease with chaperone function